MSNIQQVEISHVMKEKYLDYAISVIIGRALPDVRDGLKWVHRRAIFSMNELKITHEKGYRKCARIVGDVLGKYHPHGDSSVYDALVRLAQDFSMRYPLIDGQGNFGSIDGDSPAHMRYTEARMQKITAELLRDINKNTVDFIPNFDGEEKEPKVLPCRFPNLLVNGSEGIAVGVATSIPPHNLTDVVDTIIYKLDNPNCSIGDLVKILKAPDFPTGAEIINPQDMINIYTNGYGKINMRAKYHIEESGKERSIIFTEIPYQENKAKLLESLFSLSNDTTKVVTTGKKKETITIKAKISDIDDVVDESDREGMRINIKLKKSANLDKVLSLLFKHSNLQCNYSANFTAIYGTNQLLEHLSLEEILQYYIDHQKEVLTRRTQFDFDKSNKRLHVLEGFTKAILNLDKTIELIKTSHSKVEAKDKLVNFLQIDEEQANSILTLQLQRLTGLEIETIQNEYNELLKTVEYLTLLLNNEQELMKVLKQELIETRDKFGDERRTELIYKNNVKDMSKEELIDDFNCKIFYTKQMYIKKLLKSSDNQYMKDGDESIEEIPSTNKSTLYIFTNKANRYKIPCYQLEEKKPSQLGEYIPNLIQLEEGEEVTKIISIEDEAKAEGYILAVFENGKIAKIDIKSYISANKKLQNCYSTESKLIAIDYIKKDCNVLMISSEGKGIIVSSEKIGSKSSRNSQGNQAMKINHVENNTVISAVINPEENLNFTLITQKGKTKDYYLDDVANSNTEKSLYSYIHSNPNNQGNFILNTRANNDKIAQVIILK